MHDDGSEGTNFGSLLGPAPLGFFSYLVATC